MRLTKIKLTDSEIALLDGRVSTEAQAVVSAAVAREAMRTKYPDLPPEIAGFVADAVSRAKSEGKLIMQGVRLRSCDHCGQRAGYVKFKSGRRKGQDDANRPLTLAGVELAEAFIRVQGRANLGCCGDCWSQAKDTLRKELKSVRAELPPALEGPVKYVRFKNRKCSECGWAGHEGQMIQLPALMGGFYPGGCPACSAVNKPLHRTVVEMADGYTVVRHEAAP